LATDHILYSSSATGQMVGNQKLAIAIKIFWKLWFLHHLHLWHCTQ